MSLGRLLPDWEHTLYRAVYGACTEVSKLLDGDRPADIIRPTNVAQPISMEFEFSLVLDVVWRTFQDYARSETKAHSPASRLPPEILSYIFAYLPFEGRISTSHVSHAWRTVSLDFPATLWASVPYTHNLDIMAPLLDRTAALGLPVDLMGVRLDRTPTQECEPGICELLKRHMWHIRTLRLDLNYASTDQHEDIALVLGMPAPMLRSFLLKENDQYRIRPLSFQPTGMFHGQAPYLERLEFGDDATTYLSALTDAVAFPRVRHIRIKRVRLCPSDDAWRVLAKFAALESLEISFTPRFYDHCGPHEGIFPSLTLDRLAIRAFDAAKLVALDLENIMRIRSVCIAPKHFHARLPTNGVVPFLLSNAGKNDLEMDIIFRPKSFSFRLRETGDQYRRPRTRTFLDVDPAVISLPSPLETTFSAVTSLAIYISSNFKPEGWSQYDVAPCSNVEHLTLAYEVWNEDYTASALDILGMAFPRLRTLTLLAAQSPDADLDAHALVSALPSLRYTTPKLEGLSFRGMQIRPTSVLYDVAENVRCREEGYDGLPDLWAET